MKHSRKPKSFEKPHPNRKSAPGVAGSLFTRRRFIGMVSACGVVLSSKFGAAHAVSGPPRSMSFYNVHTGERLKTEYWRGGAYASDALSAIDHVLRDYRNDQTHPIDTGLLDLLHALRLKLRWHDPFHVISGYRSPATNAMLRKLGRGVAKNSLHLVGKAIDVRVPGRELSDVRRAALALRGGGVGYYPQPGFVHLDVGRVRYW
jgi:uncharacterized protein YcbK (DUF882 family)